jgi:hypothetical protein
MLQYLSVNAVSHCLLFSDLIGLLDSYTGMLLVASLRSGSVLVAVPSGHELASLLFS